MVQTMLHKSASSTGPFLPPQLVCPVSQTIHSSGFQDVSLNKASDSKKQLPVLGEACIPSISGEGRESSRGSVGSLSPSALLV